MNTFSDKMTPEFAARELLHSLHIICVPTPMKEVCARLGVLVERTGDYFARTKKQECRFGGAEALWQVA